jgi:hypothetical protein
METELLLSDTRGRYIPQDFAEIFSDNFDFEGTSNGYTYEDAISTLMAGPHEEWYWEAWEAVLSGAKHIEYPELMLYQDGDLFLIAPEDLDKFFGE